MTRTIDIPTFQAAVVRNCSPMLAGIKPASLFTYPGVYADQNGSSATAAIEDRRAHLLNVIAQCNHELNPFGIHLSVLVWRPCGALVYACRPNSLATYLADPRAKTALTKEGYDTGNLSACLVHLASRITLASNNAAGMRMRPNPMRIGPSSTLRQRLHLRVPPRNWLLFGLSLRRRASVYRPAWRKLQGLWRLEGLHECRAGAHDLRLLSRLHAIPHVYLSAGLQLGATCPGDPIERTNRGRTPHNRKDST